METYTKKHEEEIAAKGHVENIKKRGGTAKITKVGKYYAVEYSFPTEKTKVYQGQELRNSTTSEYVIFFEGQELKTSKSGAINSNNGIVLTAKLPTGEYIKWRSNDNYGKKGFSFDKPITSAKDDSKINSISSELRSKLEYKLSN